MGAMASQITSLTIVYSTVYSDADRRKHQSSASLAFVRGNSPHKWPGTRKMFPFDYVIMNQLDTDILLQYYMIEMSTTTTPVTWSYYGRSIVRHDDAMKWNHFPRYWPFVRGIHRSPANSPLGVFFDLRLYKRLSKQSRRWRFETPSHSLCRHCDIQSLVHATNKEDTNISTTGSLSEEPSPEASYAESVCMAWPLSCIFNICCMHHHIKCIDIVYGSLAYSFFT